jgi:hypothetical protein
MEIGKGEPTSNATDQDAWREPLRPPSISLPKGGGAIRGMGEKFTANPVTGTGSMTVPIATSPNRSGFGPQLSVSYDSAAGNSAFGFGWSLSLPAISRKTEKGLPRYRDSEESDVFILAGAEDLVPAGNFLKIIEQAVLAAGGGQVQRALETDLGRDGDIDHFLETRKATCLQHGLQFLSVRPDMPMDKAVRPRQSFSRSGYFGFARGFCRAQRLKHAVKTKVREGQIK